MFAKVADRQSRECSPLMTLPIVIWISCKFAAVVYGTPCIFPASSRKRRYYAMLSAILTMFRIGDGKGRRHICTTTTSFPDL